MGIMNLQHKDMVTVYNAYGFTVNVEVNNYVWTIRNNEIEECYTQIEILDANSNVVYSEVLGNRCIFKNVFNRHIDNILWYLAHDESYINGFYKSNTYDFSRLIQKVLIENSTLFSYRIEQQKQKAKIQAEEKARIDALKAEEERKINTIKDYAEANNLTVLQDYDCIYLVNCKNENARNLLENADRKQIDYLMKFIIKYPENKDASLINSGSLDEVLNYVS